MKKEIWKTAVVDGVENPRYKVSSHGRIMNMDFRGTGKPKICRLSVKWNGYLTVGIDGVHKSVHRIVAETFISNPEGKKEVDHINTIRTDNRVENLRWTTHKENSNNPLSIKNHSDNASMLGKFGAEHHSSVSIVQLTLNGQFIKKWSCAREVERELGIASTHITACCRGKLNKTGGFKWMYYSDWLKLQHKKPSDIKPLF